jgi:hypothetical protein
MARSRNIKPSFFTNDVLGECSFPARITFAGLWTIADREGRLEDRPKKIKAEILPYDDFDMNSLLTELHARGFIIRYSVENVNYIQVVNFTKHQNPHMKEGASTIPAPDLHSASTVPDPERVVTSPALTLNPITLTLNPITDSKTSEVSEAIALFNAVAKQFGLPEVQKVTEARKAKLKARLKDCGGLEGWAFALSKISQSDFLTGQNDKGWKADFDFLVQEGSFTKLMEGKYDNNKPKNKLQTQIEEIAQNGW